MKRIEVCGGIASGKTTFASLFDLNNVKPIYENFKSSPFWEAFYCNPGRYIFETEITFILLHYHHVKTTLENNDKPLICDFSFLLDLAYAKMGLTDTKLHIFQSIYFEIIQELNKPDLLIHLKCDPQTELKRIKDRSRNVESNIDLKFLTSLNQSIISEINQLSNTIPVLEIDSFQNDFANDEDVKREMKHLIYNQIYQYKT
jgi:deoxyadenosine/deoxycytidine kinase